MSLSPSPAAVVAHLHQQAGAPVVWLDDGDRAVIGWAPSAIAAGADWRAAGRRLAADTGGGVLGFVGFGAGHRVEAVPAEGTVPEGESWLGRFDGLLRSDGHRWVATGPAAFRREAEALLASTPPLPAVPHPPLRPRRTVDRHAYEASVQRIRDLLHAGDAYQINLTRPVWVDGIPNAAEAFACYRRLRARSPAAHGAWLHLGDAQILSNSPELLLAVDGADLRSDPIKGTRPVHPDPVIDASLVADLMSAAKDHAELTMIVDLVRNDLGRVAAPGTVRPGPRRHTAHRTVHHTSQAVTARLAPHLDPWDALGALFPPGSVTGAPKVRACQRIAQLEPHPRGVYCGTIGGHFDDGTARWSVAIRTAVVHAGSARYHVGGGIVVDSDPSDEWDETEHKGRALAWALAGAS